MPVERLASSRRNMSAEDKMEEEFLGKDCSICNWRPVDRTLDEWNEHLQSNQHTANYLKYFYNKNRKSLLSNKKSVELSCLEVQLKDCKVQGQTFPGSCCNLTLAVKNCGESVIFVRCEFLHTFACRWSVSDENNVSRGDRVLRLPKGTSDPYYVKVEVMPDFVGIYQSPLLFQFKREGDDVPFYLGVEIVIVCADSIVESLEATQPYKGRTDKDITAAAKVIHPGVKPKAIAKMKYEVPLRKYKIDEEMKEAIKDLQDFFKDFVHVPEGRRPIHKLKPNTKLIHAFLRKRLSGSYYNDYFNLLLNFEEMQMDVDIRKYDMKNAVMTRSSNTSALLSLRVHGLAEKRPSVLKGDRLYVRIADAPNDEEYEGYVHTVQESEVQLGFGPKLMKIYLPNMKFHVRFQYNKMPMNVMRRGLTMVKREHVDSWLFPTSERAAKCTPIVDPTQKLVFYNRDIEENPEQATAIKHIVAGSSLPAPYLLHGPPGTGKTVTVVEAIMQIWKLYNEKPCKAYVLVCTPSNSASDLITERLLMHMPRCDVLRYYSLSREIATVPEAIKTKKCVNYDFDKKVFYIPTKEDIKKFRVVVSTLCNSNRLVSVGIGNEHFTHVFLDECGHAVEPEALAPLTGLLKCRNAKKGHVDFGGQIVLAGDPMQLGPVIRCRVADEYNLTVSLLERLMKLDIYKKSVNEDGSSGNFNPLLLTRLKNNYRSHPAILKLPNRLFYEGELRACADNLSRESLCHWESLPNSSFPVLFHGVLGKDMQEAKNPSYFNPQEVSVVMTYIDRILNARNMGINVQHKDIGLISPYRQQVQKIRKELQKKHLGKICVGSVDEFQGQERRVIIISTVRSDPNLMAYDMKYKLGFLKNPKRLNVALTRAKCLLVVIGNPTLLSQDKHWNEFLKYCVKNGSYVGAKYESPDDEIEDVLQRFSSLNLVPVEREPVRISQRANQEDPEWRNDF